jgi:serine/threonine-protein kinase
MGPELFEVPDVSGKRMRQAVEQLTEAGFEPVTGVPEALWGAVEVSGTTPKAGDKVPRGTKIELEFDL